ncbi:beta strand repeat-containing protein [Vibrio coralliilyticus]|uniref:beta strand repeat-containing protein n=1 Tax=Vibrio coralliilyticus TaxID=190893 RepID=UPI001F5BC913|nr:choice-of-anchor U domain-containing protein [Vibrio coralliilyticus]
MAGLSQTIDFTLTGSYDVGDTRFAISATATSGLTVSFASSTPSVCTISGPYVAIGATGTCTIVASQAGDGTYDPAPDVSQSTTIAKDTQSILFPNPGPQNLADSSLTLSAVTTANLSVTFGSNTTSVCTVSGTTLSFVTSGLCTVYADQAGDSNNNAANRVTLSFYIDNDTDGDGVIDQLDAFVNDASESFDVDGDGTGNNADTNDAGDWDLSFNSQGWLVTTTEANEDYTYQNGVDVTSTDGIIAAGQNEINAGGFSGQFGTIISVNADGTLNTTFDGDGKLQFSSTSCTTGCNEILGDVFVANDGSYVAIGRESNAPEAKLVNINSTGSLTSAFSSGIYTLPAQFPIGILPLSDGGFVVGSTNLNVPISTIYFTRFKSDLTVDTSFGTAGSADVRPIGFRAVASVAVAETANYLFTILQQNNGSRYLVRINKTDGSVDTSFVHLGTTDMNTSVFGTIYAMLGTADNKILLANSASQIIAMDENGDIDESFGDGGIQTLNQTLQTVDLAKSSDGRIVVSGYDSNGDLHVARLKSDGSLDTYFGDNGQVKLDPGNDRFITRDMVLDSDNDIVIAGYAEMTDTTEQALFVKLINDIDTDGDGISDLVDTDDDGDGVNDSSDAFPLDASETLDTDGDGTGNNADTDDDGDGVNDSSDAFPLDASETLDTDGDGTGNNADTDDDGDGVNDSSDAFPLDASETLDTDGDGTGNNADTDDDGDGVNDNSDAFPLDASETLDTDGDGIGNNTDTDDDGDGVDDINDAFPLDASETKDTDGDGIGDNADKANQSINFATITPQALSSGTLAISATATSGLSVSFSSSTSAVCTVTNAVVTLVASGVCTIVASQQGDSNYEAATDVSVNFAILDDAALSSRIVLSQGGNSVSVFFADQGTAVLKAQVDSASSTAGYSFVWSQTDVELDPSEGLNSETFSFDPQGHVGNHELSVVVTDPVGTTVTISRNISIRSALPSLSALTDSDGDGNDDLSEGFGDSNGNGIPDYLDPIQNSSEIYSDSVHHLAYTETGLLFVLGDVPYVNGQDYIGVSMDNIVDHYNLSEQQQDSLFQYPSGLFDFEVQQLRLAASAQIVLRLSSGIPENAIYRKYIESKGWFTFVEDANNALASAASVSDDCPAPGNVSFKSGLNQGDDCIQLTIEDGGPNDADGKVNGIVSDPGGIAVASTTPEVSIAVVSNNANTFSRNDQEQVVLRLKVTASLAGAQLDSLQLSSSGDLNEQTDLSLVALYQDTDANGEGDTLLASGIYLQDDGQLEFTLSTPLQLSAGDTHLVITYQFKQCPTGLASCDTTTERR